MLMSEYENAQLTQQAFCQQKGILLPTFQYWRKKLREGKTENPAGFLQIRPGAGKTDMYIDCAVTLHYPNGVRVELDKSASLSTIRLLLDLV